MAAKYKLLMDYHGFFKPQGLQRTYPNVLNFEGVKGLENVKWTPDDDVPRYDTSLPFIRQVAGPMDYTPGAMRNRNLYNFRPSHSMPMSQGTRAHQVAMYVLFEAPLQMLADSPTAYMKEKETTDFIAQMPTIFDETVPLLGTVAEEVAVARKKDGVWYVGAMGNWQPREIEIDFSFLGDGNFHAEIFKDGINASRNAEDYKIEKQDVNSMTKLKVQVASGGGWAAIIKKL
jgi:alpha-glucosidase